MRPLLMALGVAALLGGTVLGQDNYLDYLSQLPTCVITCSLSQIAKSNCQVTDLRNCFCRNDTLQRNVATCVQGSCNVTEQNVASTFLQNKVCAGVPQPSRSDSVVFIAILMAAITYPILVLRCYCRYTISGRLFWDDWVAIFCTVLMVTTTVFTILNAKRGFGKHFYDVPPGNIVLIRKLFYVEQVFYLVVQNFIKISILLFYLRIFPNPRFRLITKLSLAWMAARTVACDFPIIFQCVPVSSIWNLDIHGTCVNQQALVFAGAGFSIFEDFVVTILPIPQLKSLNLSLRKRVALIFVFTAASFACVTSIVRLKYIVSYGNSIDVSWDNVDPVIWSTIESFTALTCACLVPVWPLIVRVGSWLFPVIKCSTSCSTTMGKSVQTWRSKLSSMVPKRFQSGDDDATLLNTNENVKSRSDNYKSKVSVTPNNVSDIELQEGGILRSLDYSVSRESHF